MILYGICFILEVQMEMCHLNVRIVTFNVMQDADGLTGRYSTRIRENVTNFSVPWFSVE